MLSRRLNRSFVEDRSGHLCVFSGFRLCQKLDFWIFCNFSSGVPPIFFGPILGLLIYKKKPYMYNCKTRRPKTRVSHAELLIVSKETLEEKSEKKNTKLHMFRSGVSLVNKISL